MREIREMCSPFSGSDAVIGTCVVDVELGMVTEVSSLEVAAVVVGLSGWGVMECLSPELWTWYWSS
jgi:hypothetical protein